MRSSFSFAILGVGLLATLVPAQVTPDSFVKSKTNQDLRKLMKETVPTAPYQDRMPFAKFLESIEKQFCTFREILSYPASQASKFRRSVFDSTDATHAQQSLTKEGNHSDSFTAKARARQRWQTS
jgi:hypothetical protein